MMLDGLEAIASIECPVSSTTAEALARTSLILSKGSVLDFQGDAFVNAANPGCVGGFGLDEWVNRAGGPHLRIARQALNGCPTGAAKMTPSFDHYHKTISIIHAVGPVYRWNPLARNKVKKQSNGEDETFQDFCKRQDQLLMSAYSASLEIATQQKMRTLAFSLLSAGVFRGERPLEDILEIAVQSVLQWWTKIHGTSHHSTAASDVQLDRVHLVAFTSEEQEIFQKMDLNQMVLNISSLKK